MLFNSLAFFVFFPIVVAIYFLIPHRLRWIALLAASYVFYGWWNPRYLVFLWLSTSVDFAVGLLLGRVRERKKRKALLVVSLVLNFGMLFVFKYLHFFATAVEQVFGASARAPALDLVLPVGISFYTFQT